MTAFFDTNILVYAQQIGPKGARANDLLEQGGVISVQVLNELTNVLRKKLRRDWADVLDVLNDVRGTLDPPRPVTVRLHESAISLARDHGLPIYDALIVAAAIEAGCDTLYSEDMQHGRVFGALTIHNPFLEAAG